MTKQQYSELLRDKRWVNRRNSILQRDGFQCRSCFTTAKQLNVHHKYYIQGAMPWEVPDSYLITLCTDCHTKAHEGRSISSFIINPSTKKKFVKPKKAKPKKKPKLSSIVTRRDKKLQKTYDRLKKEGKLKI